MNKYVSWRRVSTKRQGRSGLGLESQTDIINYFVEKDSGELIADYCEIYTGKELCKCTELKKAISHARREGAKLIIAKTDRFRNTLEALQILEEVGEGNIVFCDLPNTDKFTLTLFFALAEREALLVSIRTKAALAAKRNRGELTGGSDGIWGKNTGSDRDICLNVVRSKSSCIRKENALVNANNKAFWAFIKKWVNMYGEPRKIEIWGDIASELNGMGLLTATGMDYTPSRASAMYRKLKRIMN